MRKETMSVGEELEGKGGHHSNSVLSEPCGKVSHHTAHRLDLPRSLKNRYDPSLLCHSRVRAQAPSSLPFPSLPFPNERVHRPPGESWRAGLPLSLVGDSLPKRRKGWIKRRRRAYRGMWASLCLGCFGVGFGGGRSVLMREDL